MLTALTHVVGNNGKGLQVGLSEVLGQRVGVVLKAAEQTGGAPIRPLDLLPVLLGVWIQNGTPRSYQVLEKQRNVTLLPGLK